MLYRNKDQCKNRHKRNRRRRRKKSFRSSDGHLLRSRGELIVDKYLHRLNIKHIYEPRNSKYGNYIPDWVTENEYVIEYFGIKNNYRNYNQRTLDKIRFLRKNLETNLLQFSQKI